MVVIADDTLLLTVAIPGRSPVDTRGGQLQIAGVVVGSWGPNTKSQLNHSRGNHAQSRVTSGAKK